jgi:hypothetical protein
MASEAKMGKRPAHSHSIVSGTDKQLKLQHFSSGHVGLTVRSTAKQFRLSAIGGDRSRMAGTALREPAQSPCSTEDASMRILAYE